MRLPALGALNAHWREPLARVLPEAAGTEPVLDLRSTAYAQMWRPKGETAERTVTVRVLQSQVVDGAEKRTVVSHFNKATKGRIVRDLLADGPLPSTPAALVTALRDLGYTVEEPGADRKPGKPLALDVVVSRL